MLSQGNQWLQTESIDRGQSDIELSSGPVSINYDPPSGNVIAAMGILGAVVGTPDGSWTEVEVGRYYPLNFSGFTRVGALLSSSDLWWAVLAFPFSMMAIVFTVTSIVRNFPPSVLGGCVFIFVILPLVILSALLAAVLLTNIGVDNGGSTDMDGVFMFLFFLSAICSLAAILFSVAAAPCLDELVFSLRPLAVTLSVFAAMMAFVLLPFLVWAQLGDYLTFAKVVSSSLCAAAALGLMVYCVRTSRKYIAPQR